MRLSLWTCHSTKLALANKPEQPRSVSSVLQNRSLLTYHRHTRHTHRCQPLAAVEDDAPSTSSSSTAVTATKGDNTIADIEQVAGVRVIVDDDGNARAEYLVRWKDGHPDTWEQQKDIADNVLRDFEEKWWTAARTGDEETLRNMLEGGGRVLASAVNEEGRSALHYAAALGKVGGTKMLCQAGAVVNAQDKDGFTALHMATGYLHTATMKVLLEYSADPETPDRNGRSPLALAENLRNTMPMLPELLSRRMALENCIGMLTDILYEDLEPAAILEMREVKKEQGPAEKQGEEVAVEKEYLVRWGDDIDDTWVPASLMSKEVVEDFENGIEYVDALEILDMRQKGDARRFLIRWSDGAPDSWEDEEFVSPALVEQFLTVREEQKRARQAKPSTANGMVPVSTATQQPVGAL